MRANYIFKSLYTLRINSLTHNLRRNEVTDTHDHPQESVSGRESIHSMIPCKNSRNKHDVESNAKPVTAKQRGQEVEGSQPWHDNQARPTPRKPKTHLKTLNSSIDDRLWQTESLAKENIRQQFVFISETNHSKGKLTALDKEGQC